MIRDASEGRPTSKRPIAEASLDDVRPLRIRPTQPSAWFQRVLPLGVRGNLALLLPPSRSINVIHNKYNMYTKEIVKDFDDVMELIRYKRPYSWIILRDQFSKEYNNL